MLDLASLVRAADARKNIIYFLPLWMHRVHLIVKTCRHAPMTQSFLWSAFPTFKFLERSLDLMQKLVLELIISCR